jgi:hypothetical protein
MLRPNLMLRWGPKVRDGFHNFLKHPTNLWHWANTWPWYVGLLLGAVAFITFNEPIIGLFLTVLAFLSMCSNLWHTDAKNQWKVFGTIGVLLSFVLFVLLTIGFVDERPWSNAIVLWEKYGVLQEIPENRMTAPMADARSFQYPQTMFPVPVKKRRSFIFITPPLEVVKDSWDFIVALKGNEKIESIEILFVDMDMLEHLKTIKDSIDPKEYSVLRRYEQMFPMGRGQLFANQFIWKPYSFEHGHFRADISTSTGRFHQELYIERFQGKWVYASKITDIDTHGLLFECRDALLPQSVAPEITATKKCWPDMVQ